MLRPAASKSFKRLASTTAHSVRSSGLSTARHRGLLLGTALVAGGLTYSGLSARETYADAPNFYGNLKDAVKTAEEEIEGALAAGSANTGPDWLKEAVGSEELISLAWGSNKNAVVAPQTTSTDAVRVPNDIPWLRGVALRDLSLAEKYGACVDAKGDVYQWGTGFVPTVDGPANPSAVLRGKDIVSVTTTPTRLFALSSSGAIYVLPSTNTAPTAQTPSSSSWVPFMSGPPATSDYAVIQPSSPLSSGERIVQLSSGNHHLLALTSTGRVFGHALDSKANSYGQLGVRKVHLADGTEQDLTPSPPRMRGGMTYTPVSTGSTNPSPPASTSAIKSKAVADGDDSSSIRYSSTLHELPALRGIPIAQLATGPRSSLARTTDGRVLAWGANNAGQLGLGALAVDVVVRPTEVVFDGVKGRRGVCTDIATGANLTLFTVERVPLASAGSTAADTSIDVLACGDGTYGGLGAALYSSAQGQPARVKKVSGLTEFAEDVSALRPIRPHNISVSPTGHVVLTLDTLARAGSSLSEKNSGKVKGVDNDSEVVMGRDVMVWGANGAGELGNGKRSSVAVPQPVLNRAGGHLMLTERAVGRVKALDGGDVKLKGKGATVVQEGRAGWACSVVFWKVV